MEFHSSKQTEGCCSCRIVATNAEEIERLYGRKKKRELTVVYLNSLILVNLPNQNLVFCELIPKLKANCLYEWNFYF